MCKVCTGYHDANEMEHGLSACMVDNPLAKARGLSLRTGRQTTYLSLNLTALRKAKTVCNFGLSKILAFLSATGLKLNKSVQSLVVLYC